MNTALTKAGTIVKHGKSRPVQGGKLSGDWCSGSGQPAEPKKERP